MSLTFQDEQSSTVAMIWIPSNKEQPFPHVSAKIYPLVGILIKFCDCLWKLNLSNCSWINNYGFQFYREEATSSSLSFNFPVIFPKQQVYAWKYIISWFGALGSNESAIYNAPGLHDHNWVTVAKELKWARFWICLATNGFFSVYIRVFLDIFTWICL